MKKDWLTFTGKDAPGYIRLSSIDGISYSSKTQTIELYLNGISLTAPDTSEEIFQALAKEIYEYKK